MTTVVTGTHQQIASARKRRVFHQTRIAETPRDSRQRESAVLDWLRAELANGGSLDAVLDLADSMNQRAA